MIAAQGGGNQGKGHETSAPEGGMKLRDAWEEVGTFLPDIVLTPEAEEEGGKGRGASFKSPIEKMKRKGSFGNAFTVGGAGRSVLVQGSPPGGRKRSISEPYRGSLAGSLSGFADSGGGARAGSANGSDKRGGSGGKSRGSVVGGPKKPSNFNHQTITQMTDRLAAFKEKAEQL